MYVSFHTIPGKNTMGRCLGNLFVLILIANYSTDYIVQRQETTPTFIFNQNENENRMTQFIEQNCEWVCVIVCVFVCVCVSDKSWVYE